MITLAWYFLKVIICSGILCGYYFLALRNKAFHRWNRFYILASVVISFLVPIMKINFFPKPEEKGTVVQMLQTISYGDEAVVEYSRNNSFQLTTQNITEGFYLLISLVFFFIFLLSLYKITRLKKKFPAKKFEGISFINTSAKGTPFSFFKSIFWNKAIDLHSKSGQQIFNHEIAHIKEKHSYDKIFMNIVLIFFWINPFFWLMQKELFMIHEFIADKEALEDSDINSFAEMVLQTVYPGQNFSLAHNFFYSPLKRRLLMLTKNKNPKVSYISRLLVLPLAAIVFFAFTLKVKNKNANLYDGKTITVIIDAGHGGKDNGAVSSDGVKEKDIALSIAKKIADLNSNPRLKIILSRDDDQTIPVKDRVVFAKNNNANLFISVHVNSSADKQLNGFSVLVDKQLSEKNLELGSLLIKELKETYKTENKIGVRKNSILVLDKNICPSALVECGYLSNAEDAAFISNSADQEKVAQNILDAINVYVSSKENDDSKSEIFTNNSSAINDSIPSMHYKGKEVTNISVQSKSENIKVTEPIIKVTYQDGSTEMISKEEADRRGFVLPPPPPPGLPPSYFKSKALFIIDGKISTNQKAKELNPKSIESIDILKGKKATDKYGDKGKNGVIEITTKNEDEDFIFIADTFHIDGSSSKLTSRNSKLRGKAFYINSKIPDGVLIFADGKQVSEAEMKNIPPTNIQSINILKGETAINKYGNRAKAGVVEITTKNNILENTLIIIDGKESSKQDLDKIPADRIESIIVLKKEAAIVKYGNKAKDGSVEIITKKNLSMLSLIDTVPDKVFTKVEIEASFPGGLHAWAKYISRTIQDSIDKFTEADYGTCVIRFIVDVDGSVSDVVATTMKGTELAKVSISAIKKGPKWIPASQNGRTVAAYRLQPVTLRNADQKKSTSDSKSDLPKITLVGSTGGRIPLNEIEDASELKTSSSKYSIVSFKVYFSGANFPYVKSLSQNSGQFNDELLREWEKIRPGTSVTFDNVKVKDNNGNIIRIPRAPGFVVIESSDESTSIKTAHDNEKIFTKLEKQASFPGGQSSWLKYISRVIQKNGNELIADKNSEGTCKVRFIVSTDGKVSDIKVVTKQGSQLADVAVNAIKNGPRWIPGMQNGHVVNSIVIQQVRFALSDKVGLKNEPE